MRASHVVVVVVVGALLGGCSTQTPGRPTATAGASGGATTSDQTGSAGPGDLPTDGAPSVEDPLDTSRFEQEPCSTLSAEQSQGLDLGDRGSPVDFPLGKACKWRNESTRGSVQISYLTEDPRGLSPEYRNKEAGEYAYFDDLRIDGYPAAARDVTDDRKNGGCPVVVGASDRIAFEVELQLSTTNVGAKEPCDVAAEVAAMALRTIRHGQ